MATELQPPAGDDHNPLGLDGFEFIEFCAPERGVLEPVFEAMAFTRVARHRSKDVELWRQGQINLIANYEPRSPAMASRSRPSSRAGSCSTARPSRAIRASSSRSSRRL